MHNSCGIHPQEATSIYRKLWQIEDCFRVSKTDLESRPCFVWNDPRIYGHFLSCFISPVIEKQMLYVKHEPSKEEVTYEKILSSLRVAEVVYDDLSPQVPLYLRLYEEGLLDRMSEVFGLEVLNRAEIPSALRKKLHLPLIKIVATPA